MHAVRLLTLSTLTLATLEALAGIQTTLPQSWLKADLSVPSESQTPLYVTITPDQTTCQAKYGREAYEKCARPFGIYGRRVTGVRLEPAMPGTWRWLGSDTLSFTPSEAWPEKTTFKVALNDLRLPSATTLVNPEVTFSTPPLTMTSGDMTLSLIHI